MLQDKDLQLISAFDSHKNQSVFSSVFAPLVEHFRESLTENLSLSPLIHLKLSGVVNSAKLTIPERGISSSQTYKPKATQAGWDTAA